MNKENKDRMEIEVLIDGTIKISTDRISLPAHVNADAFLREIARLAGGTVRREAKHPHAHHDQHHHNHKHNHS